MSKRKKIVLISILSAVVLFLLFIGYHYVRYLQATSRMKEFSADLEKRIAEWEKKEYKRQPLFGTSIPGNAAEFYQEAESKLEDTSADGWVQVADTIWKPSIPLSPAGKVYYEKNKPLIEIVRKGTRAETYKSPSGLREGFKCKIPNLLNLRNITNLMALQARELNSAGQTSEAIKELCDIIQFGDDYLHYGTLVPAMIGFCVADIGYEDIYHLVISDKLTEIQLNELLGYLKTLIDSHPTMADSWEGEIIAGGFGLKKLSEKSGFWSCPYEEIFYFRSNDSRGRIKSIFTYGWINKTDIINAWGDYNAFVGEIKRVNMMPYSQAKDERDKLNDKIKRLKNPVSRVMLPNLINGYSAYLKAPTLRKGLYILSALQIYKIRHNAYPETLAALAPEIIPEVPLDPFSNKPFIYRLVGIRHIKHKIPEGLNTNRTNKDELHPECFRGDIRSTCPVRGEM